MGLGTWTASPPVPEVSVAPLDGPRRLPGRGPWTKSVRTRTTSLARPRRTGHRQARQRASHSSRSLMVGGRADVTASKPVNREGRPRGPVRSSTRTATDGRRCLQARQPPRSAPRSRRTESTAPTRVLDPRTPNFQGSQRGPVRGSRGPDRSSRPRARRTTARPKPDPCRGAKSRSPDKDRVPRAPTGAGARLKPPDRQADELRTGRDPGSPRTSPGTPWDTPARGSRPSPVTAPVLPLWPRAGRTSRPGTKSHPKI